MGLTVNAAIGPCKPVEKSSMWPELGAEKAGQRAWTNRPDMGPGEEGGRGKREEECPQQAVKLKAVNLNSPYM